VAGDFGDLLDGAGEGGREVVERVADAGGLEEGEELTLGVLGAGQHAQGVGEAARWPGRGGLGGGWRWPG
jgi:hypothetical protein